MKNLLYTCVALLLISSVVFVSCKDDEGNDPDPLLGTWVEKSYTQSGCDNPDNNVNETCTSGCDEIVITESNVTIDGASYPYTKTSTTITVTIGGSPTVVTYVITGSTLTITQVHDSSVGGCTNVTVYTRKS